MTVAPVIHTSVRAHISVYLYTVETGNIAKNTHMHAHMDIYMHTHTHIHIHTHTHTHTYQAFIVPKGDEMGIYE